MTPRQHHWYRQVWKQYLALRPGSDRYGFTKQILGEVKSSADFTEPEFDEVMSAIYKVIEPDNLSIQIRFANQFRIRSMHTVKSFPPAYVASICQDKFGTRDPFHLSIENLRFLIITLKKRQETLDDREIRATEDADESLQAEQEIDVDAPAAAAQPVAATEPELETSDCPF